MQRAIRHKSIEQARRLQKVDEKRQLPKRWIGIGKADAMADVDISQVSAVLSTPP